MRRVLFFLLVLFSCAGLFGCTDVDTSVKKPENPTPRLDPSKRTGMSRDAGGTQQAQPENKKSFQIPSGN